MQIGKAIAGNIAVGSLGRIITALTPLLLVPFMIRTWGLHQYGEWLILTAIPTYIMLSPDFGLAGAVVNQMAISTAGGNKDEAICLYRTSWLILTVMALVFVLAGIGAGFWVNWKTLGVKLLSVDAAGIISLSCVQIFLAQQIFLISGIYRSARRNPRYGLLGSIGGAFYLLASITALALHSDPIQYVVINSLTRALILCITWFDARRMMPEFTLSLKGASIRTIRPYIVPGLGHASMPLVNAFQNEGMLLVIGAILGPVSVAVFQTTRTAVNGGKSLMGLTASAVIVEIPALVGGGRRDSINRLLVMNTQVAIAAALLWAVALGLFGEPIFHLWLRNRTVYSAPLILIMLISLFPFAFANSFTLVLLANNKIHKAVLMLLPAGVFSLIVTAIGTSFLGLNAAAVGLIVFETLSLLVICSVANESTETDVRQTLLATFSKRSINTTYRSALSALRFTRAQP